MPNLKDIPHESYATLLASRSIDASRGALFMRGARIQPSTVNRTIFVGLGGTGIKTIDYVKGFIEKKMDPSWQQYIAFLGIDSDWNEIDSAKYLDRLDAVITTVQNASSRYHTPAQWSQANRRFVKKTNSGTAPLVAFPNLNSAGASQTRLIGKMKLHDQSAGDNGVDQEIVNKLNRIHTRLLPLAAGAVGTYEVYVIGSVCGGTGSGSFTEMPSLVKKALHGYPVRVNAMLFLPDTCEGLDPNNKAKLQANGYASLKELNYFQGMNMRHDYQEVWGYNDPNAPEITLDSNDGYFAVPYLIGSLVPGAPEASHVARETIAEFLISIIGKINVADGEPFLSDSLHSNVLNGVGDKPVDPNDPDREKEPFGESHEFPKAFAAIGFAEAAAPEKVARAYSVSKIFEKAGLTTATPQDGTAGGNLPPFAGQDDWLSAIDGTNKARELIRPVCTILDIIHSGAFDLSADLQQSDITWKKIRDGEYDSATIKQMVDGIFVHRTGDAELTALRSKVTEAFRNFKAGVIDYVRKEGPFAFYNLYRGNFRPVGDNTGIGIYKMLENLCTGKTMDGGAYPWEAPEIVGNRCMQIRQKIANEKAGLFNIAERNRDAARWVQAFNEWQASKINQVRRVAALGDTGYLHEDFVIPAALLAEQIESFGHILQSLSEIYSNFGKRMKSFDDEFANAQDSTAEVNIASINKASYDWLKKQAEDAIAQVQVREFREGLVDSFFADTDRWLFIPDSRIKVNQNGSVTLAATDWGVPARECFDQYVANFMDNMNISILDMFETLNANNMSYAAVAESIINRLDLQSQLQFHGNVPANRTYYSIMYPSALINAGGNGPAIANAIETAAMARFPGVQIYSSDDTNSIRLYRQAAPLEIYHLADLAQWEQQYEGMVTNENMGLHGMGPKVERVGAEYKECVAWKDFPSIVHYNSDPKVPNSVTGAISVEGQKRIELDNIIAEARKLGVLYSVQDTTGWRVYRVNCDKRNAWENFNIGSCTPDAIGLLPLGKALAETVAVQHGRALADLSAEVYLRYGGTFANRSHKTEAYAWEAAARVLRAHVPMFYEVCSTLEKFRVWAKSIEEYNKTILDRLKPAKMVSMIKSGIIYQENGIWKLKKAADAQPMTLVNLSEQMRQFLLAREKNMVENSLVAYYLYTKLTQMLPGDAFDAAYDFAKVMKGQLMAAGDVEGLQKCANVAKFVAEEYAMLKEKGAHLNGDRSAVPMHNFKVAMEGIVPAEELPELDYFYYRTTLEAYLP